MFSSWMFIYCGSCPSGQSCEAGKWVRKGHQSEVLMARKLKMITLILLKVYYAEISRQWGKQVPSFSAETGNRIDYIKSTAFIRGGGDDGSDLHNQVSHPEQTTWIKEFCRSPGNEFFAEVPDNFIRESMNLIDIGQGVEIPCYKEALGVLLGERSISMSSGQTQSVLQSSVTLLYGLLHARFLVSPQGLKAVLEKFAKADYGRCPRVHCQGQAVLPVGETDRPMQSSVKVFCPRCGDLYFPSGYVRACDGAFWGTTMAHLVLLGWPELRTAPNKNQYVPKIFGFKVHSGVSHGGSGRQIGNVDSTRASMRGKASGF